MATPQQMLDSLADEVKIFRGVVVHIREVADSRRDDDAFLGTPGTPGYTNNRLAYELLYFVSVSGVIELDNLWRKLRRWANKFTLTQPLPPRLSELPLPQQRIRLNKIMATKNVLDASQRAAGYTDENFAGPGTVCQKLFRVMDAFFDHLAVVEGRFAYWEGEWDAVGGPPRRRTQMISILREANAQLVFGGNFLSDNVVQRGEVATSTADELEIRNVYKKRVILVEGGLHALNRGATPPGPVPDEIDPDIDTLREIPDLDFAV